MEQDEGDEEQTFDTFGRSVHLLLMSIGHVDSYWYNPACPVASCYIGDDLYRPTIVPRRAVQAEPASHVLSGQRRRPRILLLLQYPRVGKHRDWKGRGQCEQGRREAEQAGGVGGWFDVPLDCVA